MKIKIIIYVFIILTLFYLTGCTTKEKEPATPISYTPIVPATPETKPEPSKPQIVWEFIMEEGAYESSSPILFDNVLYFASGKVFYAVDALTGKKIWEVSYATKGKRHTMYPEIDREKNLAFFSQEDLLYCIDLETKKLKYVKEMYDVSSCNAIYLYRGELYLPRMNNPVLVVNPDNGEIKRIYDFEDMEAQVAPGRISDTLVFEGDIMYVPCYSRLYAIDITKCVNDRVIKLTDPGVCLWGHPEGVNALQAPYCYPVIVGDYIYVSRQFYDTGLLKINKKTGKRTWAVSKGDYGGPIYTNGKLIAGSSTGLTGVKAVDPDTGKVFWESENMLGIPGGIFRAYNKKVYIPTCGLWYCIDEDAGKTIWKYEGIGSESDKRAEINEKENLVYLMLSGSNKLVAIKAE